MKLCWRPFKPTPSILFSFVSTVDTFAAIGQRSCTLLNVNSESPRCDSIRRLLSSLFSASRVSMDWFERLVGFPETSPEQVRHFLAVEGEEIRSTVNNRRIRCGRLDIPSLAQLRRQTENHSAGPIKVEEMVADVSHLHQLSDSNRATFQVASQFNLLEMVHPSITPEMGIGRYERDHTQGPTCAIACGGGTIYRNYFVPVGDRIGQTEDNQIDTSREFGEALGNVDGSIWKMRNGFALGNEEGLERIGRLIKEMDEVRRDQLREKVRVGIQYGTEVTMDGDNQGNLVTQVYCSAFPVKKKYSGFGKGVWEEVARVLLEGIYEITLRAAVVNMNNGGSNKVYLTLVGGGVFANDMAWILDGMKRSFDVMQNSGLDVKIVSYRQSSPQIQRLSR